MIKWRVLKVTTRLIPRHFSQMSTECPSSTGDTLKYRPEMRYIREIGVTNRRIATRSDLFGGVYYLDRAS